RGGPPSRSRRACRVLPCALQPTRDPPLEVNGADAEGGPDPEPLDVLLLHHPPGMARGNGQPLGDLLDGDEPAHRPHSLSRSRVTRARPSSPTAPAASDPGSPRAAAGA